MHRRSPLSTTASPSSHDNVASASSMRADSDGIAVPAGVGNATFSIPSLSPSDRHQPSHITLAMRTSKLVKTIRRRKAKSSAFSSFYGTIQESHCDRTVVIGRAISLVMLVSCGVAILQLCNHASSSGQIHLASESMVVSEPAVKAKDNHHSAMAAVKGRHRPEKRIQPLSPSSLYNIPHAMDGIGDKTDEYALLRKEYDAIYPDDPIRSMEAVERLHRDSTTLNLKTRLEVSESLDGDFEPYDIYNCPSSPPKGYPYAWHTTEVLQHWPPDEVEPPKDGTLYQSVCVFDYYEDFDKAMAYRSLEVPFVVRGDPRVAQSVERWNAPNYMNRLLGSEVRHRTEYSDSNHFLFWLPIYSKWMRRLRGRISIEAPEPPEGWEEPTKLSAMSYKEWLEHANTTDPAMLGPDKPHWYYRLIGCGLKGPSGDCDYSSSEFLFDELPFFQPRTEDVDSNLYLVEPEEQGGIHCRFGMQGVIAENHFDAERNAIVVLGGERRYILSHPKECSRLELYPLGHPSARHSAIDWSMVGENKDDDWKEQYPNFEHARSNELVLQAGDVLYLPTHWFHFIVSLNLNFQCNARSGNGLDYLQEVQSCSYRRMGK